MRNSRAALGGCHAGPLVSTHAFFLSVQDVESNMSPFWAEAHPDRRPGERLQGRRERKQQAGGKQAGDQPDRQLTLGVAVAVRAMKGISGSASRTLYRWRYCSDRNMSVQYIKGGDGTGATECACEFEQRWVQLAGCPPA